MSISQQSHLSIVIQSSLSIAISSRLAVSTMIVNNATSLSNVDIWQYAQQLADASQFYPAVKVIVQVTKDAFHNMVRQIQVLGEVLQDLPGVSMQFSSSEEHTTWLILQLVQKHSQVIPRFNALDGAHDSSGLQELMEEQETFQAAFSFLNAFDCLHLALRTTVSAVHLYISCRLANGYSMRLLDCSLSNSSTRA